MAEDVKCPFGEPIPLGRQTHEIPMELRAELAKLIEDKGKFAAKRRAVEYFSEYLSESNRINGRISEIEVNDLKRPPQARIAYHADWLYSIETVEVLERERVS
jgi:hypothetical protein